VVHSWLTEVVRPN